MENNGSFIVGEIYIFDIYISLFVDETISFVISLDSFCIVKKVSNFLDISEVFGYIFKHFG